MSHSPITPFALCSAIPVLCTTKVSPLRIPPNIRFVSFLSRISDAVQLRQKKRKKKKKKEKKRKEK
jgi:hypothetical protein